MHNCVTHRIYINNMGQKGVVLLSVLKNRVEGKSIYWKVIVCIIWQKLCITLFSAHCVSKLIIYLVTQDSSVIVEMILWKFYACWRTGKVILFKKYMVIDSVMKNKKRLYIFFSILIKLKKTCYLVTHLERNPTFQVFQPIT